jgi:hypothetical protein
MSMPGTQYIRILGTVTIDLKKELTYALRESVWHKDMRATRKLV